jgi:hypothetical protein
MSGPPASPSSARQRHVPEISHVRIGIPEQGALNRILREGGAQSFPQWLYAEPAGEARVLWWGIRGAPAQVLDAPDDVARAGLFPRPADDWTEAPRGLVLATVDTDRAIGDLEPAIGSDWHDAGTDAQLGARCRRLALGRSVLVLAEAATEGYAAGCLARFGEGPIAVALDGATAVGRSATSNPVTGGRAVYVRIGPGPAPTFIFLPAG